MPSLHCSSSAHVAVELDSIFASGKHRESGFNPENGFNRHDKKSMQWKLDSSSKFYSNVIL